MSILSTFVTNTKIHNLLCTYSLFSLCFSALTEATTFDIQNTTNFKFLGDAHMLNNTFRLTRDLIVPNSSAGRVLYSKPIRFCQLGNPNPTSFATHFSFSILELNPNSIGGGFAFVISPDDRSVGAADGFLGIPAGSVAVEFDTVKDMEFKDINGNHVGLDVNSMVSLRATNLDLVNVDIKSGKLIHSWVEYSGSNHQLRVYISDSKTKPKSLVLSVTIDLSQYVNEFMFVGFSGSTQGSTEVHSVEYWIFTSAFDDPNTELGPNSPPISNFEPPFNPMPYLMPPTISTSTHMTRKHRKLNKLIRGLVGALVGIVVLTGGISIYLKYQNGDQNQYYNICNCCSNVNNVAV
uniref:L-type lectin-domain containing receptor kinase VIII.2-like n=1 Tax=Erigeron canadensis TaxID=72917 RepID=UPI001CB8E605|nr:L-type lectin-domain containing receptor kinase VIII.2-like [Erigeron canadensis]